MKTKLTLLIVWVLSAIVSTGLPASAEGQQPLVITDLRGSMHIQLKLPCGDPVDQTIAIEAGRIEIRPEISTRELEIVGATFDLTRLDVFLTPFSVHRACKGVDGTAAFREIGLRLAGAVRFPAEAVGAPGSGLFRFVIPKEQFLTYASVLDNAAAPQPETRYQRPSQDVFGVIDLLHKHVQLHVVLTTQVRFRVGCVPGGHCLIDKKAAMTTTTDVMAVNGCRVPPSEVINPLAAAAPPTVSCTATNATGRFLVVASDDDCAPPTIALGSFPLANGEVIQLKVSNKPGVKLLQTGRDGVRQFQVGRGDAFIAATDATGNTTTASCR